MRIFLAERAIVAHERRGGLYTLPAYFCARSLAESALQLLFALLFALITYGLIGLASTAAQLGTFLLVVTLVTLVAESYIVLVGSVMPDEKSAAVVSPIFLALFLVTGGFFLNAQSVPLLFRLLNHANMFQYAFAAVLTNEFSGLTLTCTPSELVGPPPPSSLSERAMRALLNLGGGPDRWPAQRCPIEHGEQVLESMSLSERSPLYNAALLLLLLLAYRLLAYLALRRRFRSPYDA